MAEVGQQLILVLVVLGVTFTGPGVAIALLLRRKRVARAARRSPLTADLLRGPGHALRERLEELRSDVGFDVALLMIIPTLLGMTYLLQLQFLRLAPSMWVNLTLVIVCVAGVAHLIRSMLAKSAEMDKLRKGLDAEVAVGQELDQLMRQGAAVYHDFQAEKFNIDHIVIAPQGVFCVETKGYTKPVDADGPAAARVEFDGRVLRVNADLNLTHFRRDRRSKSDPPWHVVMLRLGRVGRSPKRLSRSGVVHCTGATRLAVWPALRLSLSR